jgi:pyruvate dehydrogenase E1 component
MTMTAQELAATTPDEGVLEEIERRVLWLAVRIIDAANHDRAPDEIKTGGHQASCASMVSVMTALYFAHLDGADLVSVKPHASPVLHAIQYLLGGLDRGYLGTLRGFRGLQSYPSRTKDPDRVDFSTGSVGLGAVAPLFAAAARRYVDDHFGARKRSRFVALVGDAELDEGNVWEAIADPVTYGLGNVLWVIDLNRQSLDRVVPGIRTMQLGQMFSASGWQVIQVKYGKLLQAAFRGPGGAELRSYIDAMPNEQYQSYFRYSGQELREAFCGPAPPGVARALAGVPDAELAKTIQNLGGHDIRALLDAYRAADETPDRPSVVFAYTVKGWGLPIAGDPINHSSLLSSAQVDALRQSYGLTSDTEWDAFEPDSPAGRWCARRHAELERPEPAGRLGARVPAQSGARAPRKPTSTQEAFGRIIVELGRDEEVGPYLVTAAPDVAVSTNLGGWINKSGIYSPDARHDWGFPDAVLRWRQHARGQHIELGISEMNLFSLLGQLGLTWDLSQQPLLPVGTVYDPFICRGLDAMIYGSYNGARFVIVGTPSGITLASEGGAHQSTITPSIGVELPGVTLFEPAYAGALDWILCDVLRSIAAGDADSSAYLRLSTRPIDNAPFERARQRYGDDDLRDMVLAGGYQLLETGKPGDPAVCLAASGAVLPEVLAAAGELGEEGIRARVIDVTSLGRLYTSWRGELQDALRHARVPVVPSHMRNLFDCGPIVTVHDASSHAMAWLGSAMGVPCVPVGVDSFGQTGRVHELYELHDLAPGHIVNAALAALSMVKE